MKTKCKWRLISADYIFRIYTVDLKLCPTYEIAPRTPDSCHVMITHFTPLLFLYPLKTSELYSQIIQHMAIYRQPTWSHKKNINFNSLLSNQISGNWSAGWWDSMSLKYTFNANKWTSSHLWLMSMQKIYIFWSVVLVFIMNFVVIVTFHDISGIFSLKKSVWPLFYGWGSTALRLQSHYEETA